MRGYIAVGLSTSTTGVDGASQPVQREPRLHPVGRLHLRSRGVVLRLLCSHGGLSYLGFIPHSDTGDGGIGRARLYGAVRQRPLGHDRCRNCRDDTDHRAAAISCHHRWTQSLLVPTSAASAPSLAARRRRQVLVTAASRRQTSSPICASTRPGVRPRSWVPLHQVNPTYYALGTGTCALPARAAAIPTTSGAWAVGAGLKLNAPMIGQGDYFQAQVNYTEGASAATSSRTPNGELVHQDEWSERLGWGVVTDGGLWRHNCCWHCNSGISLTTAWNVNAAYEHFWNPRWRTSLYGGYAAVQLRSANRPSLTAQGSLRLSAVAADRQAGCDNELATRGGSVRAPSGTSPRTSTWAWTCFTRSCRQRTSLGVPSPACCRGSRRNAANTTAPGSGRSGQLAVPLPRASRLLSVIV